MPDTLSISLTPGYLPADDELIDNAILRLIARPNITLIGSIGAATISDSAVTTAKIADGALSADATGRAKMADGFLTAAKINATQDWTGKTLSGTPTVTWSGAVNFSGATFTPPAGYCRQLVRTSLATYTTITTTIPLDNTTPASGEGTQILTASITPTSASNLLRVRVIVPFEVSNQGVAVLSLFNGTTCVAATSMGSGNALPVAGMMVLEYIVVAGGVGAITFNVNVGSSNGASYSVFVNGNTGSGLFNGLMKSTMTIEEITA